MTSIVVFALLAAALGTALWIVWRQRTASDERAAAVAERAAIAEAVQAIAHDLDNLFGVMVANLSLAHDAPPAEVHEALTDAEQAATAARALARALRSQMMPPVEDEPITPIVRLLVALQRRRGALIELRVDGELRFSGHAADAFRIVHNLLHNAVRETSNFPDQKTIVVVGEDELTIENPVRAPHQLATRLLHIGAPRTHGLGLGIARAAAARLDMRFDHAIAGDRVTFRLSKPEQATSGVRLREVAPSSAHERRAS